MDTNARLVDEHGVVRIGTVLFALIRPTPGREVAFNRWYERDHYYTAGTAAPGVFSAGRWLESAAGLHLALYFVLPGHDDTRVAFATDQVNQAAAEDRLFADREHLHTWTYDVGSTRRHPGRGVPAATVLDRRYRRLCVGWFDTDPDVAAGDTTLVLAPRAAVMPSSWDDGVDVASRRMVLAFDDVAPDARDPFADVDGRVWSAVFRPVVFGTDDGVGPGTD